MKQGVKINDIWRHREISLSRVGSRPPLGRKKFTDSLIFINSNINQVEVFDFVQGVGKQSAPERK